MDRPGQRRLRHALGIGEADGEEALHVAGAAPIEPPVALGHGERVARPVLAIDGHDIGMPREDETGLILRADTGPQIGLLSGLVIDPLEGEAVRGEEALDPVDDREIGIAARRVERHQRRQNRCDPVIGHITAPYRFQMPATQPAPETSARRARNRRSAAPPAGFRPLPGRRMMSHTR